MNILVTGSNGFIGKHIVSALKDNNYNVFEFDINNTDTELNNSVEQADYIIHLAGINRPLTVQEFYDGNTNFTKKLCDIIKSKNRIIPIIVSSSIQATLDNDYGKSKKMAEDLLFESGLPVYIFRLSNAFGKWCKPNYNSACATFCYNIAHNLPIEIRDRNHVVHYNFIDDIVASFLNIVKNGQNSGSKDILYVQPTFDCSLGKLADLLVYFKGEIESERHLPIINNRFELDLFKTFCDYLSDEGSTFNYACDSRGSFEELYKSKHWGQISLNKSFPSITKGGHYHKYKNEIFYTVVGRCNVRLRNISSTTVESYDVSGVKPEMVKINPQYTHEITNVGQEISETIMWISEVFNSNTSDTYKESV